MLKSNCQFIISSWYINHCKIRLYEPCHFCWSVFRYLCYIYAVCVTFYFRNMQISLVFNIVMVTSIIHWSSKALSNYYWQVKQEIRGENLYDATEHLFYPTTKALGSIHTYWNISYHRFDSDFLQYFSPCLCHLTFYESDLFSLTGTPVISEVTLLSLIDRTYKIVTSFSCSTLVHCEWSYGSLS